MSNDTVLNAGSGGDSVRTIDKSGVKTQVVTLDLGGSGAESLIAGALPVTGTFYQATQPVSGTFYQATQPVSGTVAVSGSVAVTGSFYQATQPVSGTFYQATQPVSIASMPSTPVTGTFWQATQPVSGTFYQATQPVSIASMPSTPVTGTFWQATQPVSGPLTDTQLRATALPVSGTFWQATQPVSGTVAATQSGTWNIGSITTLPALAAGSATIGTTLGPTLTKATQGSTGYSVQALKDAGRNARHFMLDAYTAAPVAEALQSVVQWYGNAAVGATTTPAVVPAGKTLRLTSYMLSTKSLATVGSVVVRLRANTSGTVVIGSPLVFSFEAGSIAGATTVAMTGGMGVVFGDFPDGFELPAGTGVGFTLAGYGPTGTLTLEGVTRFAVYGFEY